MYLDPQAQALADQLAHLPRPDFSTLSVADYRAMLAAFPMPSDGEDGLASITDDTVPGPGGPLPVRIFRPVGTAPLPLTVFFHGGGFISCGLDTHATTTTKRRFLPNPKRVKAWVDGEVRYIRVSASALTSAVPSPEDRGAYMSVNSALQQISGGVAAWVAGLIVLQRPDGVLQPYQMLGWTVALAILITLPLMYNVHRVVRSPAPK